MLEDRLTDADGQFSAALAGTEPARVLPGAGQPRIRQGDHGRPGGREPSTTVRRVAWYRSALAVVDDAPDGCFTGSTDADAQRRALLDGAAARLNGKIDAALGGVPPPPPPRRHRWRRRPRRRRPRRPATDAAGRPAATQPRRRRSARPAAADPAGRGGGAERSLPCSHGVVVATPLPSWGGNGVDGEQRVHRRGTGSARRRASTSGPSDEPIAVRAPGPMRGGLGSGIVGDVIGNRKLHGGDDQAVYAYAREDLDAWAAQLDRELTNGMFGENLTTDGHRRHRGGHRRAVARRLRRRAAGGHQAADAVQDVRHDDSASTAGSRRSPTAASPGAYLRVIEPGSMPRWRCRRDRGRRPEHGITIALRLPRDDARAGPAARACSTPTPCPTTSSASSRSGAAAG